MAAAPESAAPVVGGGGVVDAEKAVLVQCAPRVMLIRPGRFAFNALTAEDNVFQDRDRASEVGTGAAEAAQEESDALVAAIRACGVSVCVFEEAKHVAEPGADAVFPNNWVSLHREGAVSLYAMAAPTRRGERNAAPAVIRELRAQLDVRFPEETVDFEAMAQNLAEDNARESGGDKEEVFLEGTGSLVLDHVARVAYACLSLRTERRLVERFCARFGFTAHCFRAADADGSPIYHTNVMLAVGATYAVACLDSVPDEAERAALRASLVAGGRPLVEITLDQMSSFCGNVLEVRPDRVPATASTAATTAAAAGDGSGDGGEGGDAWHAPLPVPAAPDGSVAEDTQIITVSVMSERARRAFTPEQLAVIEARSRIASAPLTTIEDLGGGSARCMVAEVFLPADSGARVPASIDSLPEKLQQ